jgi:exopolyphosphatase/pppGpp-phosphohydrolase
VLGRIKRDIENIERETGTRPRFLILGEKEFTRLALEIIKLQEVHATDTPGIKEKGSKLFVYGCEVVQKVGTISDWGYAY